MWMPSLPDSRKSKLKINLRKKKERLYWNSERDGRTLLLEEFSKKSVHLSGDG